MKWLWDGKSIIKFSCKVKLLVSHPCVLKIFVQVSGFGLSLFLYAGQCMQIQHAYPERSNQSSLTLNLHY